MRGSLGAVVLGIGSVVNGKYRLARLLGDGGMGSVFEAQHAGLGTRVAIKVLHQDLARRTGLVERFLQEARVAAQIRNPHVVQVTDVDRTADGQAYIVMELLEGEPLSSVLERQPKLPIATACEYALQVLSALEAAHALGVIHRDLKPENVFVTFSGGRPVLKLIDFGIAKARRQNPEQKKLTVAGVVMGTAEYMSPEQARSADKVDARADVYAAGVILYEMIAGSRPVYGEDAHVIALKVERGDVVPLVQSAPDVPRDIAGLVHRAMAARPDLRFASATEMRLALEKARRQVATATASPGGPDREGSADPRAGSWAKRPTARMQSGPEAAMNAGEPQEAPVRTLRAPPLATALTPPAYAGAPVLPASPPGDVRRRGRGLIVAMVALPLLLGVGVVGVLVATGTWASGTPPAALSRGAAPTALEESKTSDVLGTPPSKAPPVSDVPKLVPTSKFAIPVTPRPSPSARPTASAALDAGAVVPPFFLPTALPSELPTFPSALPFPTSFPSPFPSVLPGWPQGQQPSATPQPSAHVPAPIGPGY
jgi:eukaryotic-like serine/threonine-protein kinase